MLFGDINITPFNVTVLPTPTSLVSKLALLAEALMDSLFLAPFTVIIGVVARIVPSYILDTLGKLTVSGAFVIFALKVGCIRV